MRTMLLTNLILASALFAAPLRAADPPAGGVTLQKCQDNVAPAKKQLSPKVAKDCITQLNADGAKMLNDLKAESPAEAADLVAYNNALVDLQSVTSQYSGRTLAEALARELEAGACPLCEMGLGPQPEKSFDWVSANAGGRLELYKKGVRTWDVLGKTRTDALAAEPEKYTKETWNAVKIMARYQRLSKWAKAMTAKLEEAEKNKKPLGVDVNALSSVLKEDLVMDGDREYRAKLDGLGRAREEAGTASLDKMKQAGKTASGLKDKTTADQSSYLGAMFDKAKPGTGDAGGPAVGGAAAGGKEFKPVPITAEQAAVLSTRMGSVKDGKFTGYLADEVKGTKAGDEVHAFFADKTYAANGTNALNLKFEKGTGPMANALGWWSGSDRTTTVNTQLVDDYCEQHKITPEQMLASEEHMKGVARYVAPNFVHETTHQRQDAWAKTNGLDYIKYKGGSTGSPYQMEMETESFSMQAAFSAEKAKKLGPAYLEQISPSHKANAIKFMEDGVDALRTEKHTLYPGISSMEGSAAQEMTKARAAASYLQILERKNKATPGEMTETDKADLLKYRGMMDSRFKWYTMVYQKSAQDEKKLLEWRDSFSEMDVTAPPKPGA